MLMGGDTDVHAVTGQRDGSLNELGMEGATAEYSAVTSGHDLTALSKLWHYMNPGMLPMGIPGATVLGGFPGLPYGQLGKGTSFVVGWGGVEYVSAG